MSCDTASVRIAAPAAQVFAFVANPANLSLWSFGTWRTEIDDSGLVRGTSIRDGAPIFVRVDPHPEVLLIDYHVGPDPGRLIPRIFIRLAEVANDACLLMMTAIRAADLADAGWQRLKTTHAFEVDLIRSAIETGYDHRRA